MEGGHIEGFKQNLCGCIAIAAGVQRWLCQKNGMLEGPVSTVAFGIKGEKGRMAKRKQ